MEYISKWPRWHYFYYSFNVYGLSLLWFLSYRTPFPIFYFYSNLNSRVWPFNLVSFWLPVSALPFTTSWDMLDIHIYTGVYISPEKKNIQIYSYSMVSIFQALNPFSFCQFLATLQFKEYIFPILELFMGGQLI